MKKNNLFRDFAIIGISVLVAILLIKTNTIASILGATQELKIVSSFVSGLFFTSVFTVAPATVSLAQLAETNSIWLVSLFGALGAVIGDIIIFHFMKNDLSDDFLYLLRHSKLKRLRFLLRLKVTRWVLAFVGAVVIASPLPDEIGLALMGLSKLPLRWFLPISFTLNAIGIYIIGSIGKAVAGG